MAGSEEEFVCEVCRSCEVSTYLQIIVASFPQRSRACEDSTTVDHRHHRYESSGAHSPTICAAGTQRLSP